MNIYATLLAKYILNNSYKRGTWSVYFSGKKTKENQKIEKYIRYTHTNIHILFYFIFITYFIPYILQKKHKAKIQKGYIYSSKLSIPTRSSKSVTWKILVISPFWLSLTFKVLLMNQEEWILFLFLSCLHM